MDVRGLRVAMGLSQAQFARDFGIAAGTLRDWEQGRKQPDGPARTLLLVILRNANVVRAALRARPADVAPPDWFEAYLEQLRIDRPELDADAFLFRASITRIADTMEREFRTLARSRLHVGMGELRVMFALRRTAPAYRLRFADLSRHMLVASSTTTKQVQRLEKQGLVERVGETGRGPFVQLTPRGHKLVSAAFAAGTSAYARSEAAFARAGEDDRAATLRFLRRVVAEIEAQPGGPALRRTQPAVKRVSIARK